MFIITCLIWLGVALQAPTWYYVLLGCSAMWQVVKFCATIFKD